VEFSEFNTFSAIAGETWVVGSTAAFLPAGDTTGSCAAAGKYQVMSISGTEVYVEGGPGALQTNGTALNAGSGAVGINDGCLVEERCHMTPGDDSVAGVVGLFLGATLIALGACVQITLANPKGYTLITQHED
jgi:hypothetical protein